MRKKSDKSLNSLKYRQTATSCRKKKHIVSIVCSCFQQLCRMETLDSSMQKLLQQWKEETSHMAAPSPSPSPSLEAGRSSVRTDVKKKTFLLKQLVTELREADTASNGKNQLIHSLIQFCM